MVHPDATADECMGYIGELEAEIERLLGIIRLDGEQHATHVRELEARHEMRHKHYCAEIERLRAAMSRALLDIRAQDAEIERLRAAGNAAFMAMCAYRDGGDLESFQDAIDALGSALAGKEK